jgi:hypothetical protein
VTCSISACIGMLEHRWQKSTSSDSQLLTAFKDNNTLTQIHPEPVIVILHTLMYLAKITESNPMTREYRLLDIYHLKDNV